MPTVGPETYLETLEEHLRRQGSTIAHYGSKNGDSEGPGEDTVTSIFSSSFFLFYV